YSFARSVTSSFRLKLRYSSCVLLRSPLLRPLCPSPAASVRSPVRPMASPRSSNSFPTTSHRFLRGSSRSTASGPSWHGTRARNDRAQTALDTFIRVSPKDSTLYLSLPVKILSTADTFTANVALITAAGDPAFRGGPLEIVANPRRAGTPQQTVIPIIYAGI